MQVGGYKQTKETSNTQLHYQCTTALHQYTTEIYYCTTLLYYCTQPLPWCTLTDHTTAEPNLSSDDPNIQTTPSLLAVETVPVVTSIALLYLSPPPVLHPV